MCAALVLLLAVFFVKEQVPLVVMFPLPPCQCNKILHHLWPCLSLPSPLLPSSSDLL